MSNKPRYQHIQHYEEFVKTMTLYQTMTLNQTMTLYQIMTLLSNVSHINLQAHIASAVSDNWRILDSNRVSSGLFCYQRKMARTQSLIEF